MTDFEKVVADLEAALGPAFVLDQAIGQITYAKHWGLASSQLHPPRFTTSIDEALRLVPKGFCWLLSDGLARITSGKDDDQKVWKANGCTTPIAICIAALKARADGECQSNEGEKK